MLKLIPQLNNPGNLANRCTSQDFFFSWTVKYHHAATFGSMTVQRGGKLLPAQEHALDSLPLNLGLSVNVFLGSLLIKEYFYSPKEFMMLAIAVLCLLFPTREFP